MFVLGITGIRTSMLIGIALLLGIGNEFDTVVSAGAYTYLPEKKINRYLKSLGIEEI